ncbi:MAG: AI-2E family transporter [Pirellulaceae bacterium]
MQKVQTICLIVLASIATGFALYYLQSVLLPFVIAVFIVIGSRPIMEYFERRLHLPWPVSIGVTFLIGLAALAALGFLIWASLQDVGRNSAAYEQRLGTIATWVSERLAQPEESTQPIGPPAPGTDQARELAGNSEPESPARDSLTRDVDEQPNPREAIDHLFMSISERLRSVMFSLVSSLSTLLSYGVLILIFVFFLLFGNETADKNRPRFLKQAESEVRRYLVLKTIISFFTGFAFGFVLWIFGVPLSILFGILAFFLNFIPTIGPLIANLLPVPFLLLNADMQPAAAIVCLVLISAIQFISGNVIETRLMGKTFDVSPAFLLLSLMFFGLVWGIVGMFLATPLVSMLKIILQQSPATVPAAELMAGRWVSRNDVVESTESQSHT